VEETLVGHIHPQDYIPSQARSQSKNCMWFHVLTVASMKMTVLLDVAPCSLVDVRRFRGAYCLNDQDRPADGGSEHL
jgi:hypothetical protein